MKTPPALPVALGLAVLAIAMIFGIVDAIGARRTVASGVVIEKDFSPSRIEMFFIVDGDGNWIPICSPTPEEWRVLIQCDGGSFPVHCTADTWNHLECGDQCNVEMGLGFVTGARIWARLQGESP